MTLNTGIWNRYEPKKIIGSGVYGRIHKAVCSTTGRVVAIKQTTLDTDAVIATTMREVAILAQLDHPNIVKMIEAEQCMATNCVFIAMEYCDQDLHAYIQDAPTMGLEEDQIQII